MKITRTQSIKELLQRNLVHVRRTQLFETLHFHSLGKQMKDDWNMRGPHRLLNQEEIQDLKQKMTVASGKTITKEEIKKKNTTGT